MPPRRQTGIPRSFAHLVSAPAQSSAPSPGQQTIRHFRRLYFIALSLIAALAIGGQILVQVALSRQSGDGHVVNKAGYQRMLSQRLTLKMLRFSPADPEAEARLGEIRAMRDRWVGAHRDLVDGLPRSAYGSSARLALAQLLEEAGRPLERIGRLADRLTRGGALSEAERSALLNDQELFLPLMDSVVLGLEQSAGARVAFLQRAEFTLLAVTLLVLSLEALLIFRPAVIRLGTSLDELERRNRQTAGSLKSLRDLTGGIAHTFNNLLTGIIGHAELERLDALRAGRNTEYIDAQLSCGRRAAAIVTQLTRYSGHSRGHFVTTEIGPWLRGIVPASAPGNPALPITVEVATDAVVAIDRAALQPAIAGILENASEAMKDHPGVIRVRLTQVLLTEPRLMSGPYRAELPPGLYACIEITDAGEGIAPGDLDRIFDPFYSRRSLGRGLGLASVFGIVHSHGGGICIESTLGEGATVSIFLPVANQPAKPAPARASSGRRRVV